MNFCKKFVLGLILYFSLNNICAQSDNELWFTANADFELSKKLELNSSISSRYDKNFSSLTVFNTQLGLTYELIKGLDFGIAYRYSYRVNTYENRIMLDAKWEKELNKRTEFSWRNRYQTDFMLSKNRPENIWRNKFELKHKIKKTKIYPYVFVEFFLNTNRFDSGLKNTRMGFGADYKKLKDQTISIGYFKSKGSLDEMSKNRNIFTIDYKINF